MGKGSKKEWMHIHVELIYFGKVIYFDGVPL